MIFESRFIGQKEIARSTRAFEFERPARMETGGPAGFAFRAGQAVDIVLSPDEPERKISQTFSLASAPEDKTLLIATRMRKSKFKERLAVLRAGDVVGIEGPFGSFRLHADTTRPAVFIAGGIGITPFRSMVRGWWGQKNPPAHQNVSPARTTVQSCGPPLGKEELPKVTLLYSNRTTEDAAFSEEFKGYARRHENLIFVPVFSRGDKPERIDESFLRKNCEGLARPVFYIAGPLAFTAALREALLALGVSDDDIRTDEFAGY